MFEPKIQKCTKGKRSNPNEVKNSVLLPILLAGFLMRGLPSHGHKYEDWHPQLDG